MASSSLGNLMSSMLSDEMLAARTRRDPAAFSELYRRHFGRVYRYQLAHTGNAVDAQDLTAQTFLAALEGIDGFREDGSFGAWLLGIARRKMALYYRSRRTETDLDSALDVPDMAPSLETLVGKRMQIAHICRLLKALSPERAEALSLVLFADLTAAETGELMGKSEAAVKMLVFRGLRELRERCAFMEEK